jgi:hypothetical protein
MRQPGLFIASEISQNRFRIAGGRSHGKVSWQVTGVRHDAYAKAHPLQVEEEKPVTEQGTYMHPEAYGRQDSRGGEVSRSRVQRSPEKNIEPEASAFARGGRP